MTAPAAFCRFCNCFAAPAFLLAALAAHAQPAAVVEMTGTFTFEPGTVEIAAGDTVEWRNVSSMPHTATADARLATDPSFVSLPDGAEPFDSGNIGPGGTFSHTFTVPGRYDYFCIPHQGFGMRGTVLVNAADGSAPEPGLADPIPDAIPTSSIAVGLTPVADGLVAPNWATAAPGLGNRLFVVDQVGTIHAVDPATGQTTVFVDLNARLVPLGVSGPETFDERGLLGLAFHPDYQTNGLLYTYTSEPAAADAPADFSTLPEGTAPDHQSVVTEWRVPAPADPASTPDPASARVLLRIDQPQFNHNGGALVFDADGLLLVALGDGGNADDQGAGHVEGGNGQSLANPLGAILRIDPLGTDSANGQYGIPPTNPFFGRTDVAQEIYAYGFRNPFRISIDSATQTLWAADAGQNDIEEVNQVTAGGNYGWNLKEGSFFFDPNGEEDGFVTDVAPAGLPADLIDPVAQYDHDEGIAAVGGFVYRGADVPELVGRYVLGDYGTAERGGRLLTVDESGLLEALEPEGGLAGRRVLGFGVDGEGELYVLANETGTPFGTTGIVLRLTPPAAPPSGGSTPPPPPSGGSTPPPPPPDDMPPPAIVY